jgi:hypothetical protein
MMRRLAAFVAQGGLLFGAILVVVAAIFWGILAGTAALIGLDPGWDFLIALVGGFLGIFPTVKAALWIRARLGRPREKPIEELAEVFE